jgi:glucose/arabinose dehydrogenase
MGRYRVAAMRRLLPAGLVLTLSLAALAFVGTASAVQPGYTFRPVASGFGNITGVTAPRSMSFGSDLYVVERTGKVWVLVNGRTRRADPFADFSGIARHDQGDNGLFSIAFSPSYTTNRLFYIDYIDANNDIRVDEFKSDGQHAIMSSQRHLLAVHDPLFNHYGGQLQFGADGKLYTSIGDGGCCGDPLGAGEDMSTMLGKLVATANPTAANPIWNIVANGLRNPWRFSFDRLTGDLLMADVGQDAWEEVDFRPRASIGANFGWSRYEGNHDYNTGVALQGSFPLTFPTAEYPHSQGCAITGGYVYRGMQVFNARGRYFYADFCNGSVWSFLLSNGNATGLKREAFRVPNPTTFGEDGRGELYVGTLGGQVLKLNSF